MLNPERLQRPEAGSRSPSTAGTIGPLPLDSKQAAEFWMTAAQSFFAIAILTNFEISPREAATQIILFVSRVIAEFKVVQTFTEPVATNISMSDSTLTMPPTFSLG